MRTKLAATALAITGLLAVGATPAAAATHHKAAKSGCQITIALITKTIVIPC
jgi:hypothetical protein